MQHAYLQNEKFRSYRLEVLTIAFELGLPNLMNIEWLFERAEFGEHCGLYL